MLDALAIIVCVGVTVGWQRHMHDLVEREHPEPAQSRNRHARQDSPMPDRNTRGPRQMGAHVHAGPGSDHLTGRHRAS